MLHKFGVFEFDATRGELRKGGRAVALEPQPAKALALLLARAGEIVSREELRDAVWGADTHVDFDRGIAYCLSQIRTALGDSGDNPRFVQTIPKRGFRFIAPVAPSTPRKSSSRRAAADVQQLGDDPAGDRSMLAASFGEAVLDALLRRRRIPRPRRHRGLGLRQRNRASPSTIGSVAGLSDLVVERLTKLAPDRIAVIGNAAVLRQPRNIRNLQGSRATASRRITCCSASCSAARPGLRFITHFIRLRDEAHLKANRLPMADDGARRARGRGRRRIRARGSRARPQPRRAN